jgi:hypothetical protein
MIVYNVQRSWFNFKDAADAYRRGLGLPPSTLIKVEVSDRGDLTALLNALCEPPQTMSADEIKNSNTPAAQLAARNAMLADNAFVEPTRSIPDYIPLFLINDTKQREEIREDRRQRGCTGLEDS